jgi:hypothetical protein
MRTRVSVVLNSAVMALVTGLGVSTAAATATTTWTITPGGTVAAGDGMMLLKDMTTGRLLTCLSSAIGGRLKSGTGLSSPLGTISSANFTSCQQPRLGVFTVTASASAGSPWVLRGFTYSSGVTHGRITNIQLSFSTSGCSGTVGGPVPASTGQVSAVFTNSTHALTPGAGNLHIWNVSGCMGLFRSGNTFKIIVKYTTSPAQTITSP